MDVTSGVDVLSSKIAGGGWVRLRTWFPEREFFVRSQGQVRFVTITSKMQILAAGMVLAVLVGWLATMGAMAFTQWSASSERAALLDREATVAASETRLDAYRGDLEATTADLARRQDFLDSILGNLPEDLLSEVATGDEVAGDRDESAELIGMIEKAIPEAAGLARLEARQLAFVERLTAYADRRATRTEEAIRTLGLDPRMMMARDAGAMGGPLEKLTSESDGTLDPRFERLALSLSRMSALEEGLTGIPQVMPADIRNISSGFGYRRDPFDGSAALHKGLDFRGPMGAPIHAAAAGRVSFVGTKSGYGRVVEVSHGNGMMTRYAHMSRQLTRVGEQVEAGDEIGKVGSSGRSTGPHLHFEVHINGRAVNPRPFLETAPDVLEEARAEFTPSDHTAHG